MTESSEPLFFVIGSSHKEADLTIRETFSLDQEALEVLETSIKSLKGIEECLTLNTCNRLEIYGVCDESTSAEAIHERICQHATLKTSLFSKHSFIKVKSEAIQHTLELASGLASQMIGETEILGQMKQAFQRSKNAGNTQKYLNRLFEKSFQTAKLIRSGTGITQGQVSIGNIAVHLATRIFGELSKSRILLIGSGEVSDKTAQALKNSGVKDITVTSRSKNNTDQMSEKFGAAAIHFEHLESQIEHHDIIISSTSAPNLILELEPIMNAMRNRPNRPLFLIDLAVPRDITDEATHLENVYLYNLDALANIANENLALRKSEMQKAGQLIKTQSWGIWLQLRRRSLFNSFQ